MKKQALKKAVRGNTPKEYAIIFGAGFLFDAILTLDTVFTSHFSLTGVFATSMTATLLSYLAFDRVNEATGVNWWKVWTYALGSAAGAIFFTWLTARFYQ